MISEDSEAPKPGTFRLSGTAHRLIALAKEDARRQGRTSASKGEMVEQAIRAAYGHLDAKSKDA